MKKKWDHLVIDQTYIKLIDITSSILDQYHIYQLNRLICNHEPLISFVNLLSYLEEELLVQWKIKKDEGIEKLFEHQKGWYHAESRSRGQFFKLWNNFTEKYLPSDPRNGNSCPKDMWQNSVLSLLIDQNKLSKIVNIDFGEGSNFLKITSFFRMLIFIDPKHHVLSFLNLIELGLGFRPDIFNLETSKNDNSKEIQPPSALHPLLVTLSVPEAWNHIEVHLTEYWKTNPDINQ